MKPKTAAKIEIALHTIGIVLFIILFVVYTH